MERFTNGGSLGVAFFNSVPKIHRDLVSALIVYIMNKLDRIFSSMSEL